MQIKNILVTTLAAAASAFADGQADPAAGTKAIYVTFYRDVNYRGTRFPLETLNHCVGLSAPLNNKASSARFHATNLSCSLFDDAGCNKPLYQGLRSSVANFHDLGIGDRIGSVICVKL